MLAHLPKMLYAHGNQYLNGKMMFVYQAQLAFNIWHNILPNVHDKLLVK